MKPAVAPENRTIKVLNIYEDEAGESHFRDVVINLSQGAFPEGVINSEPVAVETLLYRVVAGHLSADFHPSPNRQLAVSLSGGEVEYTTSDGESRRVKPGDIVLLEDNTGRGHQTRALDGLDRIGLYILLK